MKVQRIKLAEYHYIWLVLGNDHLPIKPIESFIRYLSHTEKSPHTIRCYANHLKLFWDYLTFQNKDWTHISLDDFAGFVYWLRHHHPNVIYLKQRENPKRSETTVNTILAALSSFYRYHNQLGNTSIHLTERFYLPANKHKSLLYHVFKNKPIQKRIISLKVPKNLPRTLSREQIGKTIDYCTNTRDRFLVSLLYETGLRIGQVLALRHTDIKSWDNEIHIIFRDNNENLVRNKSKKPNIIHVSSALMQLYSEYLLTDCKEINSDYVFINFLTGKPLSYAAVRKVFLSLSQKLNLLITPHMLRHTHATELIRHGWDAAFVQKRLGHASVETTINTYSHVDQSDLKRAFQLYQAKKETK